MCHPSKWGDGYYMNEKFMAFKFENKTYIEIGYLNPSKDYIYSKYSEDEIEIVEDFN